MGGRIQALAAAIRKHGAFSRVARRDILLASCAASGIAFEDRGEHELKGVPGTWKLYAVEG